MNNLVASAKKFLKNKNIVTIAGVVIILILLYIGYSTQINNAVEPVQIPVATQTIQPRTEITDDMVQIIDMPNVSLSDNVIRSKSQIVGKYSNVNSVIPERSMFYTDTVIDSEELPDAAFAKVKSGEVVYNFPVDMESTYGNSIFPGNMIDIWMKVGDGDQEKIMLGKLIENIEVLAVKDSSGRAVFENTSEERTPAMMIFGLQSNLYTMLKKASYMDSLGVELYPVPHGGEVASEGATVVSTQQLVDYIDAHSVNLPEPEISNENDELVPTEKETGGNPNTVTITFPDGCDNKYTCTYVKDGGRSQRVTKNTQELIYTGTGTLTATVQEDDGTAHTLTIDIPMTAE